MKRCRPFTLVEIMIALVLIAFGAGMAILKVRESYNERRVHTTCDTVRGTVMLASRIAKITHGEVKVAIKEHNGKYWIYIDNDLLLSKHMKTTFSKLRLLEGVSEAKISTSKLTLKSGIFSFFPWGLEDPDTELLLWFEFGKQASCPLKEYIVQAERDISSDARDSYPYEVLQDEQEASQVHAD